MRSVAPGSTTLASQGFPAEQIAADMAQQLEGEPMTIEAERVDLAEDSVSNVLKWILLVVAVASFAILGWTTKPTYEAAPPLPDRFVTADGAVLMTAADIV